MVKGTTRDDATFGCAHVGKATLGANAHDVDKVNLDTRLSIGQILPSDKVAGARRMAAGDPALCG